MIPADLAIQLRRLNDSVVQPVTPVTKVSAELPEFNLGQRFTARIEAALPDGSYRALVAGKNLTLSLTDSAKVGDTLELVVLNRTSRSVYAGIAGNLANDASNTGASTTLSQAGQIISNLLARNSQGASSGALDGKLQNQASPLLALGKQNAQSNNTGQLPNTLPLSRVLQVLPQGTNSAALLSSALQQAVQQSGLFYESHQAQWVAGRLPLDSLLREPQGQHEPLNNLSNPSNAAKSSNINSASATDTQASNLVTLKTNPALGHASNPLSNPLSNPASDPAFNSISDKSNLAALDSNKPGAPITTLPIDLQPLVQQQLDAAATQQIIWRGEVWPGQTMHWEIQEDTQHPSNGEEQAEQWNTTLRLELPQLGDISAALRLSSSGIHIELLVPDDASAYVLRKGQQDLFHAFADAGITLLAVKVDEVNVGGEVIETIEASNGASRNESA